ncbi:DUF6445 family protein [Simiduia agarivorans]|uniref:Uncharacterized protein n=1 Tax=Simiduia agarivorans (strain DSM 21679 / JCM 13881 / BCRC 17597 / SA1) TaxID=1117647 RepID=K4KIQ9_SIMAS|nr:DUF6445 family protein [Simiduia agarivorans]AFU98080.1 hypothetical protein M5M_04365 [Simiduia agarivorans SA1 = DSM 21679]
MSGLFSVNKHCTIHTIPLADSKLICIDDFLADPDTLVAYAKTQPFTPYPGVRERKGYPGVRAKAPDDYSYNMTTFVEPLIKSTFDVPAHLDIRKSICAMSLLTIPGELLGPLQRTPHFDSSTPHHIAAVLYLCGPEHGGTAFYRHKATGLSRITESDVDNYLDRYYQEINQNKPSNAYFSDENQFFQIFHKVDAKFNRLVLYRGSHLHSAYINSNDSICDDPDTGRLTVNTFFDF